MATIRKRGSKWQVQIRRQGFSPIAKSFIARNDALKWAREQERLVDIGEPLQPQKCAEGLTALLDRYEAEVTPRKRSVSDLFHIRQIRRHEIAKLTISQLTAESIAKFRDDRLKSVSPSTVRKEMALLGSVLKHAKSEWGDLPLFYHPAAIRASADFAPGCAWLAIGDLRSWFGLRSGSPVAVRLAAKATGVRYPREECGRWRL